jgi:ribonuclease BN (tRNA processing enzyme)
MSATVRLVGTGDAFGSGGRLQTCFHVESDGEVFLIDCGGTSMAGLRRDGLDPAAIGTVLVSHLHGDHYGGLPLLLLDARFNTRRRGPLTIAGPPGTERRVFDTLELLFPGAPAAVREAVACRFVEIATGSRHEVGGLTIEGFPADHPSGAPSHSLRIHTGGRLIAFSGDTQWTPSLADVAREADLFLCECYSFERRVPYHLSYRQLRDRLAELEAQRTILTHPGADLLAHVGEIDMELASDGLIVTL